MWVGNERLSQTLPETSNKEEYSGVQIGTFNLHKLNIQDQHESVGK